MLPFAAVGEVMLDLEVTSAARRHAGRVRVYPGGTAANAAVWAAAAGARATCVGRIGADAAGIAIREALGAHDVHARLAVDPREPTGSVALVDGQLVVDRGANRLLSRDDVGGISADVLLVSGYALLGEEHAAAAAILSASLARWKVVTGGSAGLLDGACKRYLSVAQSARLLVANLDEARVLTGKDDPEAAAVTLAERFELACVTAGPDGAVLAIAGATHRVASAWAAAGRARGAGDALAATLAVALARGDAARSALEQACAAGERAAASPGGWPS